jgi:hypothetical protein
MNFRSLFYVSSLLLFTGFTSTQCRNNDNTDDTANSSESTVYAAGREGYRAKYWKNETSVLLGQGTGSSDVYGMTIKGDDVHNVGYEINAAGKYVAKYWKNGIATNLTDGSRDAYANDIFISGNDIYIAGQEMKPGETTYEAKYWKNGIAVNLPDEAQNVIATGIAVAGNDVYVIGERRMQNWLTPVTCYWKNGQRSDLSDQTTTANDQDITVSGSDVYMMWSVAYNSSGQLQTRYSKNLATSVLIQDGTTYAGGTAIAVKGDDVYIAGTGVLPNSQSLVSKYWKNGTPETLGSDGSAALSLDVSGNDLYIGGYQQVSGGGSEAVYWKNGKAQQITNGSGSGMIRQIYVKQ